MKLGHPSLWLPGCPPATSVHLPGSGCRLQEESWAVLPANPELMNPRNLLPVNSLFFGVLVRRMGIRTWQAGLLLRGAQFSPQEKSELVPGPPTLVSPLQQSLVLTRGIIYLIPARSSWLLGRSSEWEPLLPALGAQGVPSSVLLAKGAGPWGQVEMADCGWALSTGLASTS